MARALIVGCGCRGRELGKQLLVAGWEVRGTSRREEGLKAIGAVGIEAALADPSRPETVLDLVGDVAVVAWILGSAQGGPEELAALHGPRLERVLERLVETPVRGFVYEAAGSVDPDLLARGHAAVEAAGDTWQIPVATLLVDPSDSSTWDDAIAVWTETAAGATLDLTTGAR